MHFIPFDLTFGIFDQLWGFSKFWRFFELFGMGFCSDDFKSSCVALHLHFNYIFMHFRCVLYMLNCCVLLGLDWVEPMMLFMLHIICSCIFMHMYLQFFYILYIDLFGAYLFVSLSPSLFLVLVCFMEPKHKSTLSQNPLRSGASFSSPPDPTPSHVWFCDDKAHKEFSKNFS